MTDQPVDRDRFHAHFPLWILAARGSVDFASLAFFPVTLRGIGHALAVFTDADLAGEYVIEQTGELMTFKIKNTDDFRVLLTEFEKRGGRHVAFDLVRSRPRVYTVQEALQGLGDSTGQ